MCAGVTAEDTLVRVGDGKPRSRGQCVRSCDRRVEGQLKAATAPPHGRGPPSSPLSGTLLRSGGLASRPASVGLTPPIPEARSLLGEPQGLTCCPGHSNRRCWDPQPGSAQAARCPALPRSNHVLGNRSSGQVEKHCSLPAFPTALHPAGACSLTPSWLWVCVGGTWGGRDRQKARAGEALLCQ